MKSLSVMLALLLLWAGEASAATISPQEAGKHMGDTVTVVGVAHVHVAQNATFLDMGGDYPSEAFMAVVFRTNKFGDLSKYDGKSVAVTGKIREYNGKPEIILDTPDQLHQQ